MIEWLKMLSEYLNQPPPVIRLVNALIVIIESSSSNWM